MFVGRFVLHAFILDPNNSKIVDFLCQNAVKFDFSDKMTVGNHSKRFKVKMNVLGRERDG